MKKLLVISFTFLVAVSMSSCTSSDANKDNGQTAASSDENMPLENGGDFGKDASVDGGAAPADGQASTGGLDDVPLDGSVDATKTAAAPDASLDLGDPENEFPADVAKSQKDGLAPTDDKVFADNGAAPAPAPDATTPPPDVSAAPPTDAPATTPPIEAAQNNDVTPTPVEAPVMDQSATATSTAVLPYEKIKSEPFEKKGTVLNRVYLARKGDTAKSISEKIYGSAENVKDLKAWNASLKNHAPRVGDKIYYNSPKNPQDTKMAVFYEDMGVEAQHYTTQAGDDIRKVSTKLLGHKDSWKEIYATNANLENKMGKVAEGTDIRYWPTMNEAAPSLAQNPTTPGGMPNDPINNLPPELPPQQVAAPTPPAQVPQQAPSAPPQQAAAVAQIQPPPPPPDIPQQAPPPPPPIERPTKKPASPPQNVEASSDPDQTMMMLAGGLLIVAAIAAFIVIKRQRAKSIDISQQTQV